MDKNSRQDMEILPSDVQAMLASGEKFAFVDVREKWEFDTAHIDGSTLIPLRDVPGNLAVFERADSVVLFCHHGMRSLDAAARVIGWDWTTTRTRHRDG